MNRPHVTSGNNQIPPIHFVKGKEMKKHPRISAMVIALLVLSLAKPGMAYFVVNGDTNSGSSPTYSGLAVAPDSPTNTYWNGLLPTGASFTSGTLKESSSNGTTDDSGITFTIAAPASHTLGSVDFGVSPPPPTPTDLTRDIVYNRATDGAEVFSFNNVPAGTYDLYFYSVNGFHQSSITQFTITTGGIASDTATNASASTFAFEDNYVALDGLSPVGGTIAGTIFDASGIANNGSSFNGFQLVQLPEPASLSLLALGGVMLLRRRKY